MKTTKIAQPTGRISVEGRKKRFSLSTKLSIIFGVLFFAFISLWFILQFLEVATDMSVYTHPWLKHLYLVSFISISLCTPTWILTAIASTFYSDVITKVNTIKYKKAIIISAVITFIFLALGAILILLGIAADEESGHKSGYEFTYASTAMLLIAIAAVVTGVVFNIISFVKSKKK